MIESIENVFSIIVEYAVLIAELAGVTIIIATIVKAFVGWIKHNPGVRLELAKGIALALEFKMGGEVLRTVVVREWSELMMLGAVMILRGAMTFLIHWEIKKEEEAEEKAVK